MFWQTEAPKHWQVRKLKHTLRKLVREKHDGAELLVCTNKGTVVKRGDSRLGLVAEDESIYQGVSAGDLLIHGMDTWHGAMAVSHYDGMCTTVVHVCDCLADNSKSFVAYYLRNLANSRLFKLISNGVRQNTSDFRCWDKLAALSIVLPSPAEQQRIVAYLDEKTSKIDRLIQLKEREIELLNEKKQAMISRIVTGHFAVVSSHAEAQSRRGVGRGLRPRRSDELVDSGVDWIGKVPRGWKVSSVRRHCSSTLGKMLQNEQHASSDSLESYLCAKDVHFTGVDLGELKKMWFSQNEKEQYRVHKGDLLIVEGGAGAGGAALMHEEIDVYVQNSVHIVRAIGNDLCLRYVWYWLYSLVKRNYIDCVSNKATIPHFTKELVLSVPLPVPPLPEQREIVAYLDGATAKIDAAVAAIEKGIGLLKERRTRLVSDAVTGRIDLRSVSGASD